ncbi:ninein [Aplysia californica]|uniref:Ninein n=1 Tax=Aplysia californica TaxID=6500 RepID=A0ABM0JG34_APLCA|nr:ninein [Aplysia californica]
MMREQQPEGDRPMRIIARFGGPKPRAPKEVEGKQVKRRRQQTRAHAMHGDKTKEETFEAEGQLMTEDGNSETGLRQLKDVCRQLGVGSSGVLNLAEFGSVCAYIGMGDFKDQEMSELFSRMDADKDGYISLSELINGLPPTSTFPSSSAASSLRSGSRSRGTTPRSRSHSRSQSRSRGDERGGTPARNNTPAQFVSGDFAGLFSSLDSSYDGFAKAEDIVDFWEGLGITNGSDILLSLGFNPHGKVKLSDLTTALDQELTNPSAPEPVHHAALICYQQEVRHLKSVVDQSQEENKKVKLDLSEANARNTLLAREVDERHAQLDQSWETKLLTVDQRYQEQVKSLQTELDKEREAGAAQAARLRGQLEEAQSRASHEEQKLAERVARGQKDISRLEKELLESCDQQQTLAKQNEQLKNDLHQKLDLVDRSTVAEDHKQELMELQQQLDRKQEETKKLKDDNDELLAQLEEVRQKHQAVQRQGQTIDSARSTSTPTQSRIPVMRGSDVTTKPHRAGSVSSVDMSETEEEDNISVASARGLKSHPRGKRPKLGGSTQSLDIMDFMEVPSLSKELSQQQAEEMLERERKDMEQRYRLEVTNLEEKHNTERNKILGNFQQEKEWLLEEQKIKEETALAEQLKDLQTAFAQEKQEMVQKHESEKNYMQHRHKQEVESLHDRLSEAESHIESSEKVEHIVQKLEAQLAQCQDELGDLENQKSELGIQLRQQEVTLRHEFEEERRNLADRFSRELEQRQMSHRYQMEQLFSKGAESLTGKLRDDFLSLVRKHTEEEVGRSQAAILNQLQQDRSGIAAALEHEKSQIFEAAENQKLELMQKYETEISSLRTELGQLRIQVEAEKQAIAEAAQRNAEANEQASQEVVHNLRREMEAELVLELDKIKETFESEKRELETQKTLLEDELGELQGSLEAERKKTEEMNALKETLKMLRAEKKEVEGMVEGMKEKLFQAYRQKGMENADWESRLQDVKVEGRKIGVEEGISKGREEGKAQGHMEGYSEGFSAGRKEGYEEGKKDGETSMSRSQEELQRQIESLKGDKSVLENRLTQEWERANRVTQQALDRDQLKSSFDQLLGEKHNLEARHQEMVAALQQEYAAEKAHLMEEIRRLETQRLQLQANRAAVEAHMGAVQQELEMTQQDVKKLDAQEDTETSHDLPVGESALQEQMTLLSYQLKEAQTAQHELGHLKAEYEALLQDKNDLEQTVHKLRSRTSEDDAAKIKSQTAQIKTLKEEKEKIQALLDESSDQLVKASTSMALAQSKFVRELESMKQKSRNSAEIENYTQLQISLVEHQRLVITLQDTLREREALVEKVIKDGEDEVQRISQLMEARLKEAQSRLDISQEQLLKHKEKSKQMRNTTNRRVLVLKDLYMENADLLKSLAESEEKRRSSERIGRKVTEKCETYKRTIDRLCHTLSR